jgi:mRNA interferase HigB
MELLGREIADEAIEKYPDLRKALNDWMFAIQATNWNDFQTMKQTAFSNVKYVKELGGYVWKIRGNNYRLLAQVDFVERVVRIIKVGKHEEYDYW